MSKIYRRDDFLTTPTVSALWLMGEMTNLRRVVFEHNRTVFYSSFSKWRKQIGNQNGETLTPRQSVMIVFLAVYTKLGKPVCQLAVNQLPSGSGLNNPLGHWLDSMANRYEAGTQTADDDAIYSLFDRIQVTQQTLSDVMAEREKLKNADGSTEMVSLRTLQRRAKAKKLSLSTKKPLPKALMKGMYHRERSL